MTTSIRQCPYCGEFYPLSVVFFRDNRGRLGRKCRPCIKAQYTQYYQDNRNERIVAMREYRRTNRGRVTRARREQKPTKCCRGCGETFPATTRYFYNSKRDGLRSRCKTCIDKQVKAYVEKNKDWLYAYQRDWKANNRSIVMKQRKRYYKKNRELLKVKRREYAKVNREKGRVYEASYKRRKKIAKIEAIRRMMRGE